MTILEGKVAIVTGAARGAGAAIAERLVAEGPGQGRFLPGGKLIVGNADGGGGENAARFSHPRG